VTRDTIGSKDPDALKIPARRAEDYLTRNGSSPFPAEPRHPVGDVLIVVTLKLDVQDGLVVQQHRQVSAPFDDFRKLHVQKLAHAEPSSQLIQQARVIPLEQIL
jgi:hypothetical protein